MNWYLDAWQRYAQFSGRASQKAFWMFFLVNCFISFVFVMLERVFQVTWRVDALYSVLAFLPMLSLTVRRLHDTNRSAWWLCVLLVPAIGMVILLVLLALPTEPDDPLGDYPQNNRML